MPLLAGREFTRADAQGEAEGRDRQRGVREEVQPGTRRGRQAHGAERRHGARHRDRRPRAEREVQRSEGRDSAAVLHALPSGRAHRRASRSTCARRSTPSQLLSTIQPVIAQARCEPAGRGPADDAAADRRERVPRPHDEHDVGGLRRAGDAARGDRSLRRARLHRGAADARDRPAHGARRRSRQRPRDGAEAGRLDDADWRRHRPRRRDRAWPRGQVAPLRDGRATIRRCSSPRRSC